MYRSTTQQFFALQKTTPNCFGEVGIRLPEGQDLLAALSHRSASCHRQLAFLFFLRSNMQVQAAVAFAHVRVDQIPSARRPSTHGRLSNADILVYLNTADQVAKLLKEGDLPLLPPSPDPSQELAVLDDILERGRLGRERLAASTDEWYFTPA